MRLGAAVVVAALVTAGCAGDDRDARNVPPRVDPSPAGPAEGTAATPDTRRPALRKVRVALETVIEGLEAPVLALHPPGGGPLYVVEKVGRVVEVSSGRVVGRPLVDLTGEVSTGSEQGLLGMVFHPDFARNGRFFVNYTDTTGDTVVAEYSYTEGGVAERRRVLLTVDQPFANHNGGHLAFGPDGYLYVGLGDGGGAGDPGETAQDHDALLGKILRIDVDGKAPYSIPPDNPFADGGGAAEVWVWGVRNPWRFSFDAVTGDLWIGDVGQSEREEIDRLRAGRGGVDLGWDVMEGSRCYEPPSGCDRSGRVLPVAEYDHSLGCSVTGGLVYRGDSIAGLRGAYLFSDYCSGRLWGLDPGRGDPVELLGTRLSVSSFGADPDGEVYLTDLGGAVVRLVPRRG